MRRGLNTFHRAAIVSGVVGVLLVVLTVAIALTLPEGAGSGGEVLVPALLGSTLKATLALAFAAVMALAARMETRRLARIAMAGAAAEPVVLPVRGAQEPPGEPARRREAA